MTTDTTETPAGSPPKTGQAPALTSAIATAGKGPRDPAVVSPFLDVFFENPPDREGEA